MKLVSVLQWQENNKLKLEKKNSTKKNNLPVEPNQQSPNTFALLIWFDENMHY